MKGCVFMVCDCRGAGSALREAIHERDNALVDNRHRIAKNSPQSEILEEVVHFLEDVDMDQAELEERIDDIIADWAEMGVSW